MSKKSRLDVWVILGYGVPKDIRLDINQQVYLRTVFNRAYEQAKKFGQPPMIICSGGPTDMFPPYRRTEAGVMVQELRRFVAGLPQQYRVGWNIRPEAKSLSTLENFLFTKKMIPARSKVTVFCEQTRWRRIGRFVPRVYGKGMKARVAPIDFDVSANRYLDPEFLAQKERVYEKFDLWALRGKKNYLRHHNVYVEKIHRMRKAGAANHVEVVKKWFTEMMNEFPTIERQAKGT